MSKISLDDLNLKSPQSSAPEDGPSLMLAQQPLAEAGKSSTTEIELPMGYLDSNKVLHTSVRIREIAGTEEDILSNQKVSIEKRLNRIIEGCVLAIGPYKQNDPQWEDICLSLTTIDREWIMLQLRILTVGVIFAAKVKCPNEECKKYGTQNVDLQEFKIDAIESPEQRTYSGVLPKSGLEFICKRFTGHDEARANKEAPKRPDDLASLAIMLRLLKLGDQMAPIPMQSLKTLGLIDRGYFRKQFKRYEGELNTTMECECPHCGHEFEEEINTNDPGFFFPSET